MNKNLRKLISVIFFVAVSFCALAQDGANNSYSPYSVYGIGDILRDGNAFTKSMGGVGIATRNRRYINYLNPASITARDSLSFMADFGLQENNKVFSQNMGGTAFKSANNTFNISDFVLSFPIWRSSAFMVGVSPFSDIGYDFSSIEERPEIIGNTNNITYKSYGNGGVYQVFIGAGATFWKRLSIGAEAIYYFGTLDKITNTVFSESSYRSVNSGYETRVRSLSGKLGIQYEQNLAGNVSMVLGATYRPMTRMKGELDDYSYAVASELTDTLRYNPVSLADQGLMFGDEIGVGISVKGGEKWSVEFDYLRSDWSKSGLDEATGFKVYNSVGKLFSASVSQSFRAGFEFTPNRNDIRYYFRRVTYRGGIYHEQQSFLIDGHKISASGITLGMTLPVFRLYNGLTFGVDLGQRGSLKSETMVRERYATIYVGFNIHDIWFQKPRYN